MKAEESEKAEAKPVYLNRHQVCARVGSHPLKVDSAIQFRVLIPDAYDVNGRPLFLAEHLEAIRQVLSYRPLDFVLKPQSILGNVEFTA